MSGGASSEAKLSMEIERKVNGHQSNSSKSRILHSRYVLILEPEGNRQILFRRWEGLGLSEVGRRKNWFWAGLVVRKVTDRVCDIHIHIFRSWEPGATRTSVKVHRLEMSTEFSGNDGHFVDLWEKGEYNQIVITCSSFCSGTRVNEGSRLSVRYGLPYSSEWLGTSWNRCSRLMKFSTSLPLNGIVQDRTLESFAPGWTGFGSGNHLAHNLSIWNSSSKVSFLIVKAQFFCHGISILVVRRISVCQVIESQQSKSIRTHQGASLDIVCFLRGKRENQAFKVIPSQIPSVQQAILSI
jgi:hypothetical protein